MKILFYSAMDAFPWGGSEELWHKTASLAVDEGHEVQVCVEYWMPAAKKVEELKNKGAKIIYRKTGRNYMKKFADKLGIQVTESYIREILNFKPDVVLISQGATFDFFRRKQIYGLINRHRIRYSLISQFNDENGRVLSNELKSSIKNTFPWDYFYFVSMRNLQTARRQCAMVLPNNKFINNLVDFSDLKLAPWPDNDILQLACVARLECACKGQDVLLETLADPYFADKNFQLSFYGSGPDMEHVQSLIDFYKLGDKVSIKGHVNSKNEIWGENHLLILPSIAEGTPLSLQECMLKGRPAMTTDVGGCAELVIDGQTGFLSSTCSQKSLKETLVKVFGTSMADLKTMGIKANEHVSSTINFNPAAVLLEDLTASKN